MALAGQTRFVASPVSNGLPGCREGAPGCLVISACFLLRTDRTLRIELGRRDLSSPRASFLVSWTLCSSFDEPCVCPTSLAWASVLTRKGSGIAQLRYGPWLSVGGGELSEYLLPHLQNEKNRSNVVDWIRGFLKSIDEMYILHTKHVC